MDKMKAKEMLFALSDSEEMKDLTPRELAQLNRSYEKLDKTVEKIQRDLGILGSSAARTGEASRAITSLSKNLHDLKSGMELIRDTHEKSNTRMAESFSASIRELQDQMVGSMGRLRDTLSSQDVASQINAHAGPLYKTMINEISGIRKAFSTWKFPQYSAVSVRNKNFANINPALDDRATTVSDGSATVITAGTRVQISATSVPVYRVIITAHESNTGTIVVGGSTCVAALSGRRGVSLFPTNSQEFKVSDLNLLYIDSTVSGDKINYYYEA